MFILEKIITERNIGTHKREPQDKTLFTRQSAIFLSFNIEDNLIKKRAKKENQGWLKFVVIFILKQIITKRNRGIHRIVSYLFFLRHKRKSHKEKSQGRQPRRKLKASQGKELDFHEVFLS